MSTSNQRSRRDRPAKPPLSIEAIVDAGIVILRSEGLDAMSMRRVAAALDTGAGSLYVYVAGRDGLIEAIFDRVLAAVELETPDSGRWREQLSVLLVKVRDTLASHPGIAASSMVDPPQTQASMHLFENLLGLLIAGGLTPKTASWTADTLFAQTNHAAIETERRKMGARELSSDVAANFAMLPPEHFPLITAHSEALVSGDFDTRFRYAVEIIIDGALANAGLRIR